MSPFCPYGMIVENFFPRCGKLALYSAPVKKLDPQPESPPADAAGFERFQAELARLVAQFEKNFKLYQSPAYSEASVRQDFLDPLFRALGWDVGNRLGLIPQHREVEIESRTEVAGRQKRADYLFRTDRVDRFVCEAKKPAEKLHAGYAFQSKRYAWNKGLVLAVLSDFEEIKIYLVGAKPHPDETDAGEWKTWHYLEYAKHARAMWDLLSRDAVAAGSIERLVASLPRKPKAKTKAKQQWLFKPDRARAIDADFLDFLDEARRGLASDLIRHNDRADLLEGNRLDEAVQRILDRLLFLRICEDRDIDTGRPLAAILKTWQGRKDTPLWRDVVAHFRALDRRPASHIPYFNGNLFKEHFSEDLAVGDDWLAGFLEETGDDESAYLFNVIPVEILGTIYERFLGKTVRPHGRGVVIEEKPEVRKAGGVYYTPRYIVDYIVEQTLGKLIEGKAPVETLKLRVLDPACGSGSFLIRAYERLCEHWQAALTKDEKLRRKADCWTDPGSGDVHLTSDLKRRILTASIYGVDLDPGAVEVTQLSLYLKMLEGESRATLAHNRELFSPDAPLLPPLQDNIKCGNSLIASDFSLNPDDLLRVRAFDWDEGFRTIIQNGGFDAVIGNPPYVLLCPEMFDEQSIEYLRRYEVAQYKADLFHLFVQKGISLSRKHGLFGMIVPNTWLTLKFTDRLRRYIVENSAVTELVIFDHLVFQDANVYTALLFAEKKQPNLNHAVKIRKVTEAKSSLEIAEVTTNDVLQATWGSSDGCIFETRLTGAAGRLVERLVANFPTLESVARASLGCQAYNSSKHTKEQIKNRVFHSDHKKGNDYLQELAGNDVGRYEINRSKGQWIKYGPWLHDYRTMDWLEGPRILIREISGPKPHSILGTYVEQTYCHYKTILNVNPSNRTAFSMKFLLGILNSQLISFLYPFVSNKLVAQAFPRLSVGDVKRLPIAIVDLEIREKKTLHDKLVALVDKMLVLVPRLRSAKSETERATLQNAVSATDRAIDALVYELYGLTPDEIALVEGSRA